MDDDSDSECVPGSHFRLAAQDQLRREVPARKIPRENLKRTLPATADKPRVPDEQQLKLLAAAQPLTGPPSSDRMEAAFRHPTIGPIVLEHMKYHSNTMLKLQEELFDLKKGFELLAQQLGKQFGLPSLTKFKAGATPLTDGRDFPGPKDISPREMDSMEKHILCHYMFPKGMYDEKYARNVSRILSPKTWHLASFNPHPRIDLATPSQLWKIWYLTHSHYKIDHLSSVMTAEEMKDSENPAAKKADLSEQSLNHNTYCKSLHDTVERSASDHRAEILFEQKKNHLEHRMLTTGAASPCANGQLQIDVGGSDDVDAVSHHYLFGTIDDSTESPSLGVTEAQSPSLVVRDLSLIHI